MRRTAFLSVLVLGPCSLALGLVSASQAPAPATSPGFAAPDAALPAIPGQYLGPASCGSSNCHGSVRPRRVLRVRQDEYFIWQQQDRHAHAYEALFDDRSAVIARNLRLGAASEQRVCLDCHALAVPAGSQQRRLEIEDGISCESCHGPASGWFESHRAEGDTHARSVAAGMTDLRDLGVRSALCLSCHLGAGGKTVDHELIAAGHPRLSFELDNYTEAMPAHWFPWADRPDRETRTDTHGTPAWAAGQAAAFRAALDELAGRARAAQARGGGGPPANGAEGTNGAEGARSAERAAGAGAARAATVGGRDGGIARQWPDFAQLECDSCHHSLAQERWRTARPPDRPGLPRWSQAHFALLRPLLGVVAPEQLSVLDPEVERLARLLGRFDTPPAEVAAAAERLSRAAADLAPRLAHAAWDDARARRLLLVLSDEHGVQEGADHQTARQLVLAVQTLASQLLAADRRWLAAGLAVSAENLSATVQGPYEFDRARLAAQLAQLRRQLQGDAAAPSPTAGAPGASSLRRP
jgi:hypothetical protein